MLVSGARVSFLAILSATGIVCVKRSLPFTPLGPIVRLPQNELPVERDFLKDFLPQPTLDEPRQAEIIRPENPVLVRNANVQFPAHPAHQDMVTDEHVAATTLDWPPEVTGHFVAGGLPSVSLSHGTQFEQTLNKNRQTGYSVETKGPQNYEPFFQLLPPAQKSGFPPSRSTQAHRSSENEHRRIADERSTGKAALSTNEEQNLTRKKRVLLQSQDTDFRVRSHQQEQSTYEWDSQRQKRLKPDSIDHNQGSEVTPPDILIGLLTDPKKIPARVKGALQNTEWETQLLWLFPETGSSPYSSEFFQEAREIFEQRYGNFVNEITSNTRYFFEIIKSLTSDSKVLRMSESSFAAVVLQVRSSLGDFGTVTSHVVSQAHVDWQKTKFFHDSALEILRHQEYIETLLTPEMIIALNKFLNELKAHLGATSSSRGNTMVPDTVLRRFTTILCTSFSYTKMINMVVDDERIFSSEKIKSQQNQAFSTFMQLFYQALNFDKMKYHEGKLISPVEAIPKLSGLTKYLRTLVDFGFTGGKKRWPPVTWELVKFYMKNYRTSLYGRIFDDSNCETGLTVFFDQLAGITFQYQLERRSFFKINSQFRLISGNSLGFPHGAGKS